MHNWPALITVFDEAQADRRYRGETKAKIIILTYFFFAIGGGVCKINAQLACIDYHV